MSHTLFKLVQDFDGGLSVGEKCILLMLADRSDESGLSWPSVPRLMRDSNLSDRGVQRALRRLQEDGLIQCEKKSGCSNSYRIDRSRLALTPELMSPPTPDTMSPPTLCHPDIASPTPDIASPHPRTGVGQHYGEPPVNHQEPYTSVTPENGVPDLFGSKPLETVVQRNGKIPDCPHLKILKVFHEELPQLTQPKQALWNGSRSKLLQDRWKWVLTTKRSSGEKAGQCYASTEAEGVEFFRGFFAYVGRNAFLMGDNDKNWTVDLGWLLKAGNFAKVMEGNYEEKKR